MSAEAVAPDTRVPENLARGVTIAAYAVLGALLVVTRLVGLDRSFWHDEIAAVVSFIRGGPSEILAGPYIPNNHELFNLLGWITISAVGESEFALRLWSVVPFMAGVIIVVLWLHARLGPLTAVLFLFLATLSPLLLDITRQARGYGLAFLAMAVLVIAALEAERAAATWTIAAVCVAGVVGTWTLPNFGLAFVATAGVLLTNPRLRRRIALGLGLALAGIAAWYAPHVDALLESSRQEFGAPIPWFGLITSPVEQVVAPALLWIDGIALTTDLTRLPLVAALTIAIIVSPLLREVRVAMVIGSGVVLTMLVIWAAQIYLSPRFVSYLLVPLFMLLASGIAQLLTYHGTRARLGVGLALTMLALVAVSFGAEATPVLRLPREAHRDAVDVIRAQARTARVVANTRHPSNLEYYLGRSVERVTESDVAARACAADEQVVYVVQPFGVRLVALPCALREGVRRYRFEQYTRGGEITVYIVPTG